MANNRMWLVHRPSGKAVMLAKRMSDGWYVGSVSNPDGRYVTLDERLDRTLKDVEGYVRRAGWDDFCLSFDVDEGAPHSVEMTSFVLGHGPRDDWRPGTAQLNDDKPIGPVPPI